MNMFELDPMYVYAAVYRGIKLNTITAKSLTM